MKKILLFVFTAAVLFALSAGGSYFWRRWNTGSAQANPSPQSTAPQDSTGPGAPGGIVDYGPSTARGASERTSSRPAVLAGTDAAVQLAETLRERELALNERERKLNERQKQLELIYQDIRGEAAAVDALRKQVSEEYKALERLMQELEGRKSELDQHHDKMKHKMDDLRKEMVTVETIEREGIKRGSEIIEAMPPEIAAEVIQQMADGGNMDSAVKMLSVMKQSKAAQVLALLPDRSLGPQLLKKLETLNKKPAAPAKP